MKRRILFVDDESRVLEGLRRMLWSMRQEWDMVFVDSGPKALEEMARGNFDVIVTDMRMPGMDGAQLLREVKRINSRSGIPNSASVFIQTLRCGCLKIHPPSGIFAPGPPEQ